jgi:hypothetical protein
MVLNKKTAYLSDGKIAAEQILLELGKVFLDGKGL